MAEEVSVLRLYVMRCMYLLNFVLLGSGVWVQFIHRQKPWDPITGVAFSFWAALASLSAQESATRWRCSPSFSCSSSTRHFGCSPYTFLCGLPVALRILRLDS